MQVFCHALGDNNDDNNFKLSHILFFAFLMFSNGFNLQKIRIPMHLEVIFTM